MLKRLKIRNFQSHIDTDIEFVPGVNVIVGKSQAGKTAILRALDLVSRNRPTGFRYHTHGQKGPTKIELEVPEGKVTFRKTKTKAAYILNDDDGNPYTGFGSKVPDKVTELLNLTDLNMQKQLDTPFLATSTGGEVARTINRITHLEQSDKWAQMQSSEIRRLKNEISLLNDEIEDREEELDQFKGLDEIEDLVKTLQTVDVKVRDLEYELSALEDVMEDLERVDQHIFNLKKYSRAERFLNKAEEASLTIESLKIESVLLEEYLELHAEVQKLEGVLPDCEALLSVAEEVDSLEREEQELEEAHWFNQQVEEAEARSQEVGEEFVDMISELGKCPLCFSEIDQEVMETIKESIQ